MLTPPGPTSSPTTMSTIPRSNPPRTMVTIPAMTSTTAINHKMNTMSPSLSVLGARRVGHETTRDTGSPRLNLTDCPCLKIAPATGHNADPSPGAMPGAVSRPAREAPQTERGTIGLCPGRTKSLHPSGPKIRTAEARDPLTRPDLRGRGCTVPGWRATGRRTRARSCRGGPLCEVFGMQTSRPESRPAGGRLTRLHLPWRHRPRHLTQAAGAALSLDHTALWTLPRREDHPRHPRCQGRFRRGGREMHTPIGGGR
jgi:hypothetical protein